MAVQASQQRLQHYSEEEDEQLEAAASPRASTKRLAAAAAVAAAGPGPLVKERSDGKPERQAAKRFKTSVQLHGAYPHRVTHLRAFFSAHVNCVGYLRVQEYA